MDDIAARWTTIKALFSAARDLPAVARAAYLRAQSGGDADLEREVLRLLELDAEAGAFLETPAAPGMPSIVAPTPFLPAPGDRLADRYRVLSAIGRGGMGEVYEAFDEVMHESLAVKVARPDREPFSSLAERWRREVQLARRVSHRGVCRVHDVAVHHGPNGDLLFLTMERLHGQSLQARLESGDLTEDDALVFGRQIADALDAAHVCGVLHRDVKPDNVVIDTTGATARIVLTDFGLAREVTPAGASRVTRTGWVAGTPGYLAPEVLRGEPPSFSSDLYALAVVVRQMLTAHDRSLDVRATAVFVRALADEPTGRFRSAAAFMDALEASLRRTHASQRLRPRRLAGAVALALVALVAAWFRFYIGGTPRLAASSQILLTDMVNGTGEADLDGAGEILRSQLTLSPHFELLDSDRIRHGLGAMRRPATTPLSPDVARELALREGAALVAYSALTRLGQDRVVSIKLEAVGARPSLARKTWTESFSAPSKTGVFEAIHDAALWVRRMAGEAASTLESQDRSPAETTTSSWDALNLYKKANELSASGRTSDAALLLQGALRLDSDFAMAHMRLGDDLISLKRDKEGYAEWSKAVQLVEHRESTSREALRIRGQFFDDIGNLPEAESAYRTYTLLYPNDGTAAFLLGHVLVERDHVSEARIWLEKACSLQPLALTPSVHLALTYLDMGRDDDALAAIARVDAIGAKDWAQWLRSLRTLFRGELDGAIRGLDPLFQSPDLQWRSRVFLLRASWLTEAGRDRDAIADLREGIAFDDAQGFRDRMADKLLMLADLRRRGHDAGFSADVRQALDTASSARRIATAVALLVRGDRLADARRLLDRFDEFPKVPVTIEAAKRAHAEVLSAAGKHVAAVADYDEGLKIAPRRSQSRLPLVRALVRAGNAARATDLLWTIVEHPATVYPSPESQSAGPLREAIGVLLALPTNDPARLQALRTKYSQFIHR